MRDITREEAVRLFHKQWSDMQKDLGNKPTVEERPMYKEMWCENHKPREAVYNNCFLCDYVKRTMRKKGIYSLFLRCQLCPIVWPTHNGKCYCNRLADGTRIWNEYYLTAPISEILALPESEVEVETVSGR